MKKIIYINLLLILTLGTLVSCVKETLDKQPHDRFSEVAVWGDINLAKAYLNEVYLGIGQWGISRFHIPREMANSATDECMQRGNHGMWVFNQGNITSSNYGLFDMWTPDYLAISRCNIFLQRIGDVPGVTTEELNSLKAQARFIRAIVYEDLLTWYSWWEGDHNGVPIITEPFSIDDKFEATRSNYNEVVSFIVKELDEITNDLPLDWNAGNWGRVTKGAALALKSEILLYAASKRHNASMDRAKWQAAADAANAVIQLNKYALTPVDSWQDYSSIFLNSSNPEIILARPYDPTNLPSNWVDLYNTPNGYGGWGGNCPTQQMVDRFEMANGKSISDPSSGYDPQNPYVNREMRFYANIVYNDREYRGRKVESWEGGLDSQDGPTGWNVSPTNYTLYKFMNEAIDFQKSPAPTPFIIFRLAEIYLNYAEAEYQLGNEDVAREYLNKIRTRAKLPEINSTGSQLLQDIMHERGIELAFEKDFRWNDVRRWEILDQTASVDYMGVQVTKDGTGKFTYTVRVAMPRVFDERMYSLPIPLGEMQKAPELNQNPGY